MQRTQKWLYTSDLKTTNSVKKKKKQSTYPSPKKFQKQKSFKNCEACFTLQVHNTCPSLPGLLACFLPSLFVCLLAPLEVALRLQQQMGALCLDRFLLQQKKFKHQHK
jgi:hypothetical protein